MRDKGLHPCEVQLPEYSRKRQRKNVGKRMLGRGAKSTMSILFADVEFWFEEMRSESQYVDKTDVVEEFECVAKALLSKLTLNYIA